MMPKGSGASVGRTACPGTLVLCTETPAPGVLLPWAGSGHGGGRAHGHSGTGWVPATASAVPASTFSSLLIWANDDSLVVLMSTNL